jgi:prepilin-type N-terminal cleavage/methylation domain-containing protein
MRDDGFTLLEILVAVVVFGFVVAGLVQATHFGITAWDVQTRMVDRAQDLERVDRVLRLIVEQASPPLAADDKPFNGQEHRLDLITRLPLQPQTDPGWIISISPTARPPATAANGCAPGTIPRCPRWCACKSSC